MTQPSTPSSQRSAEPALLRRINVRTILEVIEEHGPSTRAELTRLTGISPPTMSKLMEQLTEAKLLEADPKPVVTNGRPGVRFRFVTEHTRIIGIHIADRQTTLLHAGLDGKINAAQTIVFDSPDTYEALIEALVNAVNTLQKQNPETHFVQIALGVAGIVHAESGRIEVSPNMHQLDGKCPAADLTLRLDIPAVTIHEMNALCLGILRATEGKGLHNLACITYEEGLGCGLVNEGQLLLGRNGYANELGHITIDRNGAICGCGNKGCLETLSTDVALAQALSAREGRTLSIDDVLAETKASTLDPAPEIDDVVDYLSIAVAATINLFDPEAIFLSGHFLSLAPELPAELEKRARTRALGPVEKKVRILQTQLTVAEGAIAGAIHEVYTTMGPALDARR